MKHLTSMKNAALPIVGVTTTTGKTGCNRRAVAVNYNNQTLGATE